MQRISKDTPCYFFTSVTNNRLAVFQTDKIKVIACKAIDEARNSGEFYLFAYVIMHDHIHTITGSQRKPSDILRYINGVISKRVIDYLKENDFESSLAQLRIMDKKRNYKHSLWQHHNNTFSITSDSMMLQKVNYIHQNPVVEGLVEKAEDYLYSSVRYWKNLPLKDEPLEPDIKKIIWRS